MTDTVNATDTAEATVTTPPVSPLPTPPVSPVSPLPTQTPPGGPAAAGGTAQGASPTPAPVPPATPPLINPETALGDLKAAVSFLHTVVHNTGHFATLAFDDVEQAVVDITRVVAFIRSKV